MVETKQLAHELEVEIPAAGVLLQGNLAVPENAVGVVLFAHGSGSSRFSPRNRFVARILQEAGLATLLMDLLTDKEEAIDLQTRHLRFDIDLLAGRLMAAVDWLGKSPATRTLAIGCFGSSTGAAAALIAAADRPAAVRAVVSRGGRPDLAGGALTRVRAPSLFIVGGLDQVVIELNQEAMARIQAEKRLEIVAGATHLFEESGKLDEVARLTSDWFRRQLGS
ncbi:MAG: dienelactone hydrolase family protein [Deltaproteobacteria bacterium]|jgi:putative phosphoribosyl transferase